MNGKELKVAELELKFGGQPRLVNVFGVFRYKPNNGLYVIYADVGTTYDYVCYGSSHVKNDSILCMSSNKDEDIEAVKEYIFKVTSGEELSDYEIIPLDNIKEIEIISSKNFEIKREVLNVLIDKTIPKKEIKEEDKVSSNNNVKKKKSPIKTLLVLLLLLIVVGFGYMFFMSSTNNEKVVKVINCKKTYNHDKLDNVVVDEEKEFTFNNYDKLSRLNITTYFNFNTEDDYYDFINKSLDLRYTPQSNKDTIVTSKHDDQNHKYIVYEKISIDESYDDSIEYEEILSVNTKDNYNCEEKIEK